MISYQQQFTEKAQRLQQLLMPFSPPALSLFPSPENGYRMRVEFRIWHDEDGLHYAMSPPGQRVRTDTVIKLEQFPPACASINDSMPALLAALQKEDTLRRKLYQVEFLASQNGELLVSLIYHRRLDDEWASVARGVQEALNIAIIGRSRKQKIALDRDYVNETFSVHGRDFHYRQYEQSFSQPNAAVCQSMLNWACEQAGTDNTDLLELYCGNGNFTLPLATGFSRVLATEISKSGIKALRENLAQNRVDNVAVARLSAEEFSAAYRGEREFTRLKQDQIVLSEYAFDTVFVDPPRAGIDDQTLALLQTFPRILYISCNPETLAENLAVLCQTHRIQAAALFDQFPFTPHIESGVLLVRKPA